MPVLPNVPSCTSTRFVTRSPNISRTPSLRACLGALAFVLLGAASQAAPPTGYYDSANGLSGTSLKNALHNIIKGHTVISYSAAENALKYVDEDPNNTNNVLLHYTGTSVAKSSFASSWNREHAWPQSLGADVAPKESDLHHLFAEDMDMNSRRGNSVFNFVPNPTYTGYGNKCTSTQFEPRDAQKGDLARALLYMDVRYDGTGGETDMALNNSTSPAYNQMGVLSTLLEWNRLDPPDQNEQRRNDRIYSTYQHNRNPFVDHPEYADLIWGSATVTNGDTLNVTPANRAGATVNAGTSNYALLSLGLAASANEWDLASLSVSNTGTLADSTISAVKLYRDADNSGSVSAGDSLLASASFSSANATLSLGTPQRILPAGMNLLLAASLSSSATPSQTLRVRLNSLTHAATGGNDTDPVFASPVESAAALVSAVAPTGGVRIVMVSTRGSDGTAAKEFIALSNPGASAVSLASWQIRTRAGGDTADTVLNLSGTAAACSIFVIASSSYGSSVEGVAPGQTTSGTGGLFGATGMGDTTARSIGLFDATGTKVDGFSFGGGANNPNSLHEGTPFSQTVTSASTQAYRRKLVGGVFTDTDVNANDLEIADTKTPPQISGVKEWSLY